MKNKWGSLLLCIFLGWLGVHRYYEGKIVTGVLYTLTLGFGFIGVLIDLWYILITPNIPVEKSGQYNIYLNAIEMLTQNGYSVSECKREWCIIESDVSGGGKIFVVSDPRPGLLSALIGAFSADYKKMRYETTSYNFMQRYLEHMATSDRSWKCYSYWPDNSLVGGYLYTQSLDPAWLNVLKSAID
jgi:TM2 domain-containing membrane protein YozV